MFIVSMHDCFLVSSVDFADSADQLRVIESGWLQTEKRREEERSKIKRGAQREVKHPHEISRLHQRRGGEESRKLKFFRLIHILSQAVRPTHSGCLKQNCISRNLPFHRTEFQADGKENRPTDFQ
mmetsp:Transcript_25563/g.50012  ORF Transcript_25563/g.50012 Transcript_25563/m.50012 type:complete len:125 (-) Transcript_25563:344-718(-)